MRCRFSEPWKGGIIRIAFTTQGCCKDQVFITALATVSVQLRKAAVISVVVNYNSRSNLKKMHKTLKASLKKTEVLLSVGVSAQSCHSSVRLETEVLSSVLCQSRSWDKGRCDVAAGTPAGGSIPPL